MQLYIKAGEFNGKLDVNKKGLSQFRINIDERVIDCDFNSEKYVVLNGKRYYYEVKYSSDGIPISIIIEGEEYPVDVKKIDKKRVDLKKEEDVSGVIRALLAGKIIAVNVREGEKVKENQVILILEAMKMENEIRAPFSGIVKSVKVKMGDSVLKDEILIEIAK